MSEPTADEALLPPAQLERYADAIVRGCLALDDGDTLIVSTNPAHRELAVALAAAGYRAGARLVDVAYDDPRARAARMRHAREEDLGFVAPWALRRARAYTRKTTASVTILGEADEGVFDGLPPERIAADFARQAKRLRSIVRAAQRGRRRWTGVAWPTPAWAARVYPDLDSLDAQRRLAGDLLSFCRLGPDDPPGFEGWAEHTARLLSRGRALTDLELEGVELRGPGTDLVVRLVPGTLWLGGPRETAWGHMVAPNFPTEENFTSPEARSTEGTFRCSRPLSFRGRVIDGIAGEFRSGRLVRLEADDEHNRAFLAGALDSDRNARRLGEVALVDRSSRIGRTGRVYWNTLIDENAAAHIAFGAAFDNTRVPLDGARGARGLNRSTIHLDVMIGSDELEATGIARGGRRVPLIRDGSWQIG